MDEYAWSWISWFSIVLNLLLTHWKSWRRENISFLWSMFGNSIWRLLLNWNKKSIFKIRQRFPNSRSSCTFTVFSKLQLRERASLLIKTPFLFWTLTFWRCLNILLFWRSYFEFRRILANYLGIRSRRGRNKCKGNSSLCRLRFWYLSFWRKLTTIFVVCSF